MSKTDRRRSQLLVQDEREALSLRDHSYLDRIAITHEFEGDPALPWLTSAPPVDALAFFGTVDVPAALANYPHTAGLKALEFGPGARGTIPWDRLGAIESLDFNSDLYTQLPRETLPSLRCLAIWGYARADMTLVSAQTALTQLEVKADRHLNSLAGLQHLQGLLELSVVATAALADTKHLPSSVTALGFTGARKLGTLDCALDTPKLARIFLDDCAVIATLDPLRQLPNLREVSLLGSTDVADGRVQDIVDSVGPGRAHIRARRHYDLPS